MDANVNQREKDDSKRA